MKMDAPLLHLKQRGTLCQVLWAERRLGAWGSRVEAEGDGEMATGVWQR